MKPKRPQRLTCVARLLKGEMARFGISRERLVARAMQDGISAHRVDQVLYGDSGWLKTWNMVAIDDWKRLIQTAWNVEVDEKT